MLSIWFGWYKNAITNAVEIFNKYYTESWFYDNTVQQLLLDAQSVKTIVRANIDSLASEVILIDENQNELLPISLPDEIKSLIAVRMKPGSFYDFKIFNGHIGRDLTNITNGVKTYFVLSTAFTFDPELKQSEDIEIQILNSGTIVNSIEEFNDIYHQAIINDWFKEIPVSMTADGIASALVQKK
jgi:hypothetical protein